MTVKPQGDAWEQLEQSDMRELSDEALEHVAGGASCRPHRWQSTGAKRVSHGTTYYEKRCTQCGATTWLKTP